MGRPRSVSAARGAATFASRYSERHGRSAPRMITGARQDGSRRFGATKQSRRSSEPARAQNDAPERRTPTASEQRRTAHPVRSRSASTLGVGRHEARSEPLFGGIRTLVLRECFGEHRPVNLGSGPFSRRATHANPWAAQHNADISVQRDSAFAATKERPTSDQRLSGLACGTDHSDICVL